MKHLKLVSFFFRSGSVSQRGHGESPGDQVHRERSVLQAFAEYADVAQNVYVCRSRNKPTIQMKKSTDAARYASRPIAGYPSGKGIALMAVMPIEEDALLTQYVDEVLSRVMCLEREEKTQLSVSHDVGVVGRGLQVANVRQQQVYVAGRFAHTPGEVFDAVELESWYDFTEYVGSRGG
ncbi:hypothetical protein GQ600_19693 [Phytophthora cactorum]|nr:hypothetical protein GQ600_19693 [Phytophthora cactorum]